MNQPDPNQGIQPDDDELDCHEEALHSEDEDNRPPAASLTSIRLTRRRPTPEPRLVQRLTLPLAAGAVDAGRDSGPEAGAPLEEDPSGHEEASAPTEPESPEPHDPVPPLARAAPAHGGTAIGRQNVAQQQEAIRRAQVAQRHDSGHRPSNIVDYWSRLRAGRAYPAPADLDSELIVATWPNSILLRHQAGESGMRAAALYKPSSGLDGASDRTMDFSPMVVEWMLALAEETVRSGQPMAEKELFERPGGGPVRFAACALPLSADQETVDHVLCYLRALG